ncbi:NAD-binding protein [bacterium]|nr:NAD-binding protein [bacterium]
MVQSWRRFWYSLSESARNIYEIARHEGLLRFISIIVLILTSAAIATFVFEYNQNREQFSSVWDAIWWSVVTAATVGYGDTYPITYGGRIIALSLILVFILVVMPLYAATITSAFVTRRIKEGKGLEEVKFLDHLVICGWNPNGEAILTGLRRLKHEVAVPIILIAEIAEDDVSELLYRYEDLNFKFVHGDFSVESVLRRANVSHAKYAIILADCSNRSDTKSDDRAILATLAIKGLNSKMRVCVEVIDQGNVTHLKRARADEIIVVGEHSGYLLTAATLAPGIPDMMRKLTSLDNAAALWERKIPRSLEGKTFAELSSHYLSTSNEILIGVIRYEKMIALDDVLGDDLSSIDAFIKQQFTKAGKKELTRGAENVEVHVNPGPSFEIRDMDTAVVVGYGGSK